MIDAATHEKASGAMLDERCFGRPRFPRPLPGRLLVVSTMQRSVSWLPCGQPIDAGIGIPPAQVGVDHAHAPHARGRVDPRDTRARPGALRANGPDPS